MTQQRYHTRHYDSLSAPHDTSTQPEAFGRPAPRGPDRRDLRQQGLPSFVEPGQHAGDVSTLRFLADRKLRQFDVEGPSPMALSLNGQPLRILRPGQNTFEPPLPLVAGDVLQLEVLAEDAQHSDSRLSGWNTGTDTHLPGQSR